MNRTYIRRIVSGLRNRANLVLMSPSERRHALVGPISEWKHIREFQIGFLCEAGLAPDSYLLEFGCGTLRGGLPIIEYLQPGHYYGFDIRDRVIEEARKELAESGLEHKKPVLRVSHDLTSLDFKRKLDFLWAFSVLFHMEDEILDACLRFTARHMQADGVLYANVGIGDKPPNKCQGFPAIWRSTDFYKSAGARANLSVTDLGPVQSATLRSSAPDSQMLMFKKESH